MTSFVMEFLKIAPRLGIPVTRRAKFTKEIDRRARILENCTESGESRAFMKCLDVLSKAAARIVLVIKGCFFMAITQLPFAIKTDTARKRKYPG